MTTLPTRSPERLPLLLAEFDKQVALEAFCQGQTVIPFWCDACHAFEEVVLVSLWEGKLREAATLGEE